MATIVLILCCAAVFLGALAQRTTGLGFALVASPLLIAALGPVEGVALGNLLSACICLVVLSRVWRDVLWRPLFLLSVPAAITVPLGAWVVKNTPTTALAVLVGCLALIAVLIVALSRQSFLLPGRSGAILSGGVSGFMNATAGVGGPVIVIHAISERWPHAVFLGTGQVFFLFINVLSLWSKGVPDANLWLWLGVALSLIGGAVAGEFAARHISAKTARALVLVLASVGSVSVIIRGLLSS